MSIETLTDPALPVATGTYDTLDQEDANYTTTAGTVSGNNKTLALRMVWPDAGDTESPRPLVLYCATLGWTSSDPTGGTSTLEDLFVSAGAITASVGTRVIGDDPLSTGENSSMSSTQRAQNAAIIDINTALRYVLANYSEHANGTIEPSMVFLAGTSAGAISAMGYTFKYPSHPIAGVFNWSGAFGTAVAATAAYLRNSNMCRENYLKASTCSFLGGADATIDPTYIELLRSRLLSLGNSTIHYDPDGDHVGPAAFDVTALTDASTVYEAASNYLIERCNAMIPARSLRNFPLPWNKNWYKLEARYR